MMARAIACVYAHIHANSRHTRTQVQSVIIHVTTCMAYTNQLIQRITVIAIHHIRCTHTSVVLYVVMYTYNTLFLSS
jgi:hypothetical protein